MKNIRQSICEAVGKGSRKTLLNLAAEFEMAELMSSDISDEAFEFILDLLSSEELFNRPGMSAFLVNISFDMNKFSLTQKAQMLSAVQLNYSRYSDLEFCWVLCDIVARNYERSVALKAFGDLVNDATSEGRKGIALGLDAIAKQSKRDSNTMTEIEKVSRYLSQR
ncbi:hypothetical protein [Pseudomonas palmensis]